MGYLHYSIYKLEVATDLNLIALYLMMLAGNVPSVISKVTCIYIRHAVLMGSPTMKTHLKIGSEVQLL